MNVKSFKDCNTVKEYLEQYRTLNIRIDQLLEKANEARLNAVSMSPVQGNGSSHGHTVTNKVANGVERYDYYIRQADILISEKDKLLHNIVADIKKLSNLRYRAILYLRYIKLWKWDKIACSLIKTQNIAYDELQNAQYIDNVRKNLHGKALEEYKKTKCSGYY